MNNFGFIRVAAANPILKVGDCDFNLQEIISLIDDSLEKNVSIINFPELSITGYTCGDLFYQNKLLSKALETLITLKRYSADKNIVINVGLPIKINNAIYNCSCLLSYGEILGIVPKTYLPSNNEFYEKRWFSSSLCLLVNDILIDNEIVPVGSDLIFSHVTYDDLKIGIEICEDLWAPLPPSSYLSLFGASIILNPSASNELVGKSDYRKSLVSQQSARTISGYVYSSSGYGESTTDLVYSGHCLIYENGSKINENKKYNNISNFIYGDIDLERISHDRIKSTSYTDSNIIIKDKPYREVFFDLSFHHYPLERYFSPHPFVPKTTKNVFDTCEEIFSIQTYGLVKRLEHIGCKKTVIGVSGGLDSTLALLVTAKAFDILKLPRKNIIGITMPGFGTTDRTYNNAVSLITNLDMTFLEVSITDACLQHFEDILHDITLHDITYENSQARERTQILMDIANKENAIVIGTGDLSELALGWATYNGDHMSMYAVNSSIPKTLVRYLVEWVSKSKTFENLQKTLEDVLNTPVSPELIPPDEYGNISQKTEDMVGPYELHDFFLYYLVRFGFPPHKIYYLAEIAFHDIYCKATILKWLKVFYKRFFAQQFKRSCLPDGPKVGSINLSPRGDWRMPSDADVKIWFDELEAIDPMLE